MSFYLQKTILYLLLPPSGPLIIVLAGFILSLTRLKKTARACIGSGFLILYLFSISAVSDRLLGHLEQEHRPLRDNAAALDAVVVLTSGVVDLTYLGLDAQPSSGSVHRLAEGIAVYRLTSGRPLIICGGAGDPAKREVSEAAALAKTAISLGVPEKDIIVEGRSKNTYEGAREVGKLLGGKGKRIVLVTSAYHMGRSAAFFRKAGFEVIPDPTGYMAEKRGLSYYSFIPGPGSLAMSSTAVYEYLSRLWYFFHS